MFLHNSEREKNNTAVRSFIARLAMMTMVKLRDNDGITDSILPMPSNLAETTRADDLLLKVVNNIIKNELKVLDVTSEVELGFNVTSPFYNMDIIALLEHDKADSNTISLLGEKVVYTVDRVRNTVLVVIKELIKKVKSEKLVYESSRKAANIAIIPNAIPEIIEYLVSKSEINGNGIFKIPTGSSNANENTIKELTVDEINESALINELLAANSFNEDTLKTFLGGFGPGEVLNIARSYLTDLTDNNTNLVNLSLRNLNKTRETFLVYLIAKMYSSKYYADNLVLTSLLDSLKIACFNVYTELKADGRDGILVEYIEENKIYINQSVWDSAPDDLDITSVVGAALALNIQSGTIAVSLDDIVANKDLYSEAFNKYEAANNLAIQTGMQNTLVNIFTNAATEIYGSYKTEDMPDLNNLEIGGRIYKYLKDKTFKDIVEIEETAEDLVLNLIYTDEASRLFIKYFNSYSSMEASLTPQDCAMLAGVSLVVLEIGSHVEVKHSSHHYDA